MNKISKKDGTYVLEPGSGAFGFIICDMDGNVIGVEVVLAENCLEDDNSVDDRFYVI